MGYCVKLDVQKHNCKACVGVLVHLDITLLEAGCGIVHTSALGWRVLRGWFAYQCVPHWRYSACLFEAPSEGSIPCGMVQAMCISKGKI